MPAATWIKELPSSKTLGCGAPLAYSFPFEEKESEKRVFLKKPKMTGNNACVAIMAVLVLLVLWNLHSKPFEMSMPSSGSSYVQSMFSRLRSARSGSQEKATAKGKPDFYFSPECHGKEGDVHNLTCCPPESNDEQCQDWTNATAKLKASNAVAVREFVKSHEDKGCAVLFFAPWCPHCGTFLPVFMEVAKELKIEAAVVNCELVPRLLIGGQTDPQLMEAAKKLKPELAAQFDTKATKPLLTLEAFPTVAFFGATGKKICASMQSVELKKELESYAEESAGTEKAAEPKEGELPSMIVDEPDLGDDKAFHW